MELTQSQGATRRQRRQWWRVYGVFFGALLFVYGALVLFLAVLGPALSSQQTVLSTMSVGERALHAASFLFLGQTTWPAILCIMLPAAIIIGLYITQLAGPFARFEQSANEFLEGNLSQRIRLRRGDQMSELAASLNAAVEKIEHAMSEIRDREARERKALRDCLSAIKQFPPPYQQPLAQIEVALKEGENIEGVLNRFRFSPPR